MLLKSKGFNPDRKEGDVKTEIAYRRLQAWAVLTGDADHQFLSDVGFHGRGAWNTGGNPLGASRLRQERQKERRIRYLSRWEEDLSREPVLRDNYASAKGHMAKVKKHVEEDLGSG